MPFDQSMTKGSPDDEKINSHYKNLLSKYLDTMTSSGKPVQQIAHKNPNHENPHKDLMHTDLMTWSELLEAMDTIQANMCDTNLEDEPIGSPPETTEVDDKEILDELDKLFTPVLVMQGFEQDIADQTNNELAESSMLTERNVISFDDETRMSQLIGVCAKLLAKKKQTEAWQMYQKAAAIKKQASLRIQNEEYEKAKALATQYLVKVSTSNNSSVARNAANELLPQTNH